MKLTGVEVFDATIERSTSWLQDLMRELNWSDRRESYVALRSVLHGLRDHLPVNQAVQFGNQLPMLIRGFYFESWNIQVTPLPWTSREELLAGICRYFNADEYSTESAETVVRAVFRLLDRKVIAGEIEDFHNTLPGDIQALWAAASHAA